MGYPYFVFKNQMSKDFNIIVNKLPPVHSISNDVEYLDDIPGRSGYLTIDNNKRKPVDKVVTFTIYPDEYLEYIKNWLQGSGKLIFSNEPDVYYIARIDSVREYEGATNEKVATVSFKCQPFAYLHGGDEVITITSKNKKLFNKGETSKPIIKVYGSGAIDLIVNDDINKFTITNDVEIDSELQESYTTGGRVSIKGKFPQFKAGENNISWNGNVEKIEVIPRWHK